MEQSCRVKRPAATETVKGPVSSLCQDDPSVTPCWRRQEKRPQTKNRRSILGRAKCDRRGCRSNTRTLQAQPAQHAVNTTHQHGDPHSPPETRSDCPLQTTSKLRITCGRP